MARHSWKNRGVPVVFFYTTWMEQSEFVRWDGRRLVRLGGAR